ncbi:class I glutamine amidotransferase-like protein [Piedraia hortae CBS 480.64]|uniref:Class I glutamine amidotransferase-like protein n=1 Tax=Piedraia hortae CBS 480.64 TaxID=1314780 RepID=A0A6A7C3L3_9PEZI|nr:class I glutamine amidotransferase-like protein [Piedraia hortae CBS 480.64]
MSVPKTLKVAILEADTPHQLLQARWPNYTKLFSELFEAAAGKLSPPPELEFSRYDVVNGTEYPNPDNFDAVLITGSRHNAHDKDPWILNLINAAEKVLAHPTTRLVGICFGHQIVARALGSETGPCRHGWEVSVLPFDLSEKGREIFGSNTLAVHQMHRDIVYSLPPGVQSLGRSPTCDFQGMYKPNRVVTVQGHPEFKQEFVETVIRVRHENGILDDQVYEDAMRRVGQPHDGVRIAEVLLKFMLGESIEK